TLDDLGLEAMLEMTRRFGLGTLTEVERYGLGLTLGGGEVRLLDLANAYAALGAGGRLAEPFAVARVRDAAGRVLYERAAATPALTMHDFARPAGIVEATICAPTGLLPGPDCPAPVRELFVAGTVPTATERYYARDAEGRITVDPPIEARDWARAAGLAVRADGSANHGDPLRLVVPVPGTVIYLAPELPAQRAVFRAAVAAGIERVSFAVDGVAIGDAPAAAPWGGWALAPGMHVASASG